MDDFLNYLIKKSDIKNNEYFNYKQNTADLKNSTANKRKPSAYQTFADKPDANTYVVFDFETTGLNPDVNNIIEIGAVKVIDGKAVKKFSRLVNPNQYIPRYISSKVHITNEMVRDKESIDKILPLFIDFIGDLPLAAHNASFDMSFLEKNAERLNLNIKNDVIDTLKLSRKYNKECKKHNLGYLTDFFNIDLKYAHRALFDAYATHLLYQIIRQKYIEQQ